MNRCSSCVHWENPWNDDDGWNDLVSDPAQAGWGTCQAISLLNKEFEEASGYALRPGEALAFTRDGSEYRADLHTRGDFGCVLHRSAQSDTESTDG